MTTLAETIKNNAALKQNGGLYETSNEELGTLSDATGRAANPISPLGAKLLGSNPDQVKMAGSSANKQAALNASVSGDLSLRDTIRQSQASTQSTDEEKARKEKEEQLSKLQGTLDGRVQQIAEQKLGGNVNYTATQTVNADKVKSMFPSLDAAGQGAISTSISNLLSNPSDLESATAVATALGFNTTNLSSDELLAKVNQTLDSEKDSLSGLAGGIDDSIKMSDVFGTPESIEALGDPADLAEALGISEEDFQNLDVAGLKSKMDEMGLQSFHDVAELQRKAADPYTTGPERVALNRELQRLGASGVRGTEQQYQKLQDEVNSADTVEVGGQSYTTEQLLSDENVSAMVADYLTDPEAKKALDGTPLAAFIERNKAVLTQAANNLSSSAKALVTQNQANRDLARTANGVAVPDNVMKALFSDYGKLGVALDPTSSPEYQKFKNLPSTVQDGLMASISGVQDPAVIKSVLGADPAALQALTSSGGLTTWINFRQNYDAAVNADPKTAVNTLLGMDPSSYADALKEYQNAKNLGLINPDFKVPLADVLDQNHDGVLDDPAVMKAALLQHYQSSASTLPGSPQGIPDPKTDIGKLNEITGNSTGIYGVIRDYVKADGVLDAGDVDSLSKNGNLSEADYQAILDSGAANGAARESINKVLFKKANDNVMNDLQANFPAVYNELHKPDDPTDILGIKQNVSPRDMYAGLSSMATLLQQSTLSRTASPATKQAAASQLQSVATNAYLQAIKVKYGMISGYTPSAKEISSFVQAVMDGKSVSQAWDASAAVKGQ